MPDVVRCGSHPRIQTPLLPVNLPGQKGQFVVHVDETFQCYVKDGHLVLSGCLADLLVVFHRVCPEPVPLSPGGAPGIVVPLPRVNHLRTEGASQVLLEGVDRAGEGLMVSPAHPMCLTSTSDRGLPRR